VQRGVIVPSSRTVGGHARYTPEDIKAILARVRPGKSPGSKYTTDYASESRGSAYFDKSREPAREPAEQFMRRLLFKYRLQRGMPQPGAARRK
jgi:hypothetical protein